MILHSRDALKQIDEMLAQEGITDCRFCVENDCYVCDINGNFYSVCKRQMSRYGNLVELYSLTKLKGSIDKYGYVTYQITVDGVKKHLKGHRLMLNAWVGEEPELCVNHKDGNKKNNALSNLEWCTVAENNAHAIATGLFDPHSIKQTYAVPPADWVSIYILNKHCGYSQCELGRMNGVSHSTIAAIIRRLDSVFPEVVKNGA